LNLILGPLDLRYLTRDGAIVVTSRKRADLESCDVVYDVSELIESPGGDLDELIADIQHQIAPKSWAGAGGQAAIRVEPESTRLVVTQSFGLQEEIAGLIERHLRLRERDQAERRGKRASALDARREERPPTTVAQLRRTDVLPHAAGSIKPGRNYVYGIATALAWHELCEGAVMQPIALEGEPPLVEALNATRPVKAALEPTAYVAVAGTRRDGVLEQIRTQLTERFPGKSLNMPAPEDDDQFVLYAYLYRRLKFKEWFDRMEEPLGFQGSSGIEPVENFGIAKFSGGTSRQENLREQLTVLDYQSDNDFIVQLHAFDSDDRLILAKIAPSMTLVETVAAVERRIVERTDKVESRRLIDDESVIVPVIDVDLVQRYPELRGKRLRNAGWESHSIGEQVTRLRFRLDESGATVEIEEELEALTAGERPPPRHFVFDKPFLVYLQTTAGELPYLAIWVDNAEVLSGTHDATRLRVQPTSRPALAK
jgi:hypothetical protein